MLPHVREKKDSPGPLSMVALAQPFVSLSMETKEAFAQLIAKRGVYKELGVPSGTVKSWRNRLNAGELSEEMMEEILKKAGWEVKKVIQWFAPKE